jgi:ankyrin repeat protein
MITVQNLKVLEALFTNVAIPEMEDTIPEEFLTIAIQLQRVDSLPKLVGDPNQKLKDTGMTLLEYAVYWGKSESVSVLLRLGADPNVYTHRPLLMEVREIAVFRELLEYGAHPDVQDDYGRTALMVAPSTEFVRELLYRGAEVELTDKQGRMAIEYLCRNEEVVKMLIDKMEWRNFSE